MLRYVFWIALASASFLGCQSTAEDSSAKLETYFPDMAGTVTTYDVVDSVYTTGGWRVQAYRRRETAGALELDQSGQALRRLSLDTASAGQPFSAETSHWLTLRGAYAERIEGSDRVLVLSYPIERSRSWNGNVYNDRGTQYFNYSDLDSALTLTVNGSQRALGPALRVQQSYVRQPEAVDDVWELYAPGVGRVLRVDRQLRYDVGGVLLPTGTRIVRQTLVSRTP